MARLQSRSATVNPLPYRQNDGEFSGKLIFLHNRV